MKLITKLGKFKKQKTSFNLTFRYIDDVISLNNPNFSDYIDVIYPKELEIKDTTDAPKWANYIDHLEFDKDGKLFTQLYDKRDDFDFPIVNFPYLSSNIPGSPAYDVFVSQLIRYAMFLFKIWRFSVQRIYSGFKVIETGIFLTETSDYFSEILWLSYIPCSQIWHLCVAYVEWSVHWLWHMTGFHLFCINCDGCHVWGRKCWLSPWPTFDLHV